MLKYFLPEIYHSRERFDGISLSELRVLNLYHVNTVDVTFIVNAFESIKNMVTDMAVQFV